GLDYGKALFAEHLRNGNAEPVLVLDHQDRSVGASGFTGWSWRQDAVSVPRRLIRARQQDFKAGTLAGGAHNVDCAPVVSDNSLHNGQPQAAPRKFRRKKGIEEPGPNIFCHAATTIADCT